MSYEGKTIVPVKVCGFNRSGTLFTHEAYVREIGRYGARLRGISALTCPGEIIEVECKGKANFQVVWVGKSGPLDEEEVGILSLEPDKCIWDVDTQYTKGAASAPIQATESQDAQSTKHHASRKERRKYQRHSCSGRVHFRTLEGQSAGSGDIRDLSLGGCYISMVDPVPVGTELDLKFEISGKTMQAKGKVVTQHKSVGMGLEFLNLAPQEAIKLLLAIRMIGSPDVS